MKKILLSFFVLAGCSATEITFESVQNQFEGKHCKYGFYSNKGCYKRDPGFLDVLKDKEQHCKRWAAECLREFNRPESVKLLMDMLQQETDIQTCDGVIPIRTSAVQSLAVLKNKNSINALIRHFESEPRQKLSKGASGCIALPEDKDIIRKAVKTIQKATKDE